MCRRVRPNVSWTLLSFLSGALLCAGTSPVAAQLAIAHGSDFNGDGFDDLAIGIPGEAIGDIPRAGAVEVLYGSAEGLSASADQIWHRGVDGVPGEVTADDRFGSVIAVGNFDGDEFDDLVIASPTSPRGDLSNAGFALVLYGSSGRLSTARHQHFQPGTNFLFFGAALAAGDFDRDGFDDLAVGVPRGFAGRGGVLVARGGPEGLSETSTGQLVLTKRSLPNPPGDGQTGDFFGQSLAAGDFDRDGFVDLAIGAPSAPSALDRGILYTVFGSPEGLQADGNQAFTQSSSGIQGAAELGDRFAERLVAGDFDSNGASDLVVGIPREGIEDRDPAAVNAGAVAILYGFDGLSSRGNQLWHQDVSGIDGVPETGDHFGSAVAVADFDRDGFADVAIGVPGEGFAGHEDAGVVHVLYGSFGRLSADRQQMWHHDSPEVARGVEASDAFGAGLGIGDFDGDGFADLAIGVPGESFAGNRGAGGVTVLYGTSRGLRARNNQFWYQDVFGIEGGAERGDDFGRCLSGGAADSPF